MSNQKMSLHIFLSPPLPLPPSPLFSWHHQKPNTLSFSQKHTHLPRPAVKLLPWVFILSLTKQSMELHKSLTLDPSSSTATCTSSSSSSLVMGDPASSSITTTATTSSSLPPSSCSSTANLTMAIPLTQLVPQQHNVLAQQSARKLATPNSSSLPSSSVVVSSSSSPSPLISMTPHDGGMTGGIAHLLHSHSTHPTHVPSSLPTSSQLSLALAAAASSPATAAALAASLFSAAPEHHQVLQQSFQTPLTYPSFTAGRGGKSNLVTKVRSGVPSSGGGLVAASSLTASTENGSAKSKTDRKFAPY